MKIEHKIGIEIVGVVAVVASLLFVGFEIRQSREIAISETVAANNGITQFVQGLIIENSSVWEKGCLAEDLTSSERIIFKNVFIAVYELQFTRYLAATQGISNRPLQGLVIGIALNRYRYPGYNQMYLENLAARANPLKDESSVPSEWITQIEAAYQQLLLQGEEISFDVAFCGAESVV